MGMVLRLMIGALAIVLLWRALKLVFIRLGWYNPKALVSPVDEQEPSRKGQVETIVRCHVCGVHLPLSEAHNQNGHHVCAQHA